jgi:X-X-X-Leu-X-X-Gly heptad repeat protein
VDGSAQALAAGAQELAGSSSEIRSGPDGNAVPVNEKAR